MTTTVSVRDWLASEDVADELDQRYPLSERQFDVLEQAAHRGYLLDLATEPREHRLCGPHRIHTDDWAPRASGRDVYRAWALASTTTVEELEALSAQQATEHFHLAGEPYHLELWTRYAIEVLNRPALAVSRFTPYQTFNSPAQPGSMPNVVVGFRVETDSHLTFHTVEVEPATWSRLIHLVAPAAAPGGWLRFRWRRLTAEVPREDAAHLAGLAHDLLEEGGWRYVHSDVVM